MGQKVKSPNKLQVSIKIFVSTCTKLGLFCFARCKIKKKGDGMES